MKPTPGPWGFDSYNTVFAGSEQNHDLVEICKIPDEPETGESRERSRDEWYPESAANAILIAAAPELLEAASRAHKKLSAYIGVCKDDKELPKVIKLLLNAIAKAEGRA